MAQLSPGDSHCAAGGAAITDARGTAAYVCSGQNGKDGQPFSGTFRSPNGEFALSVADGGVQFIGPDSKISLPDSGGVTVTTTGTVSVTAGELDTAAGDESVSVQRNRTESVGGNTSVGVGGNRNETVGGSQTLTIGGARTESVGAADGLSVGGNRGATISGNETITIHGSRTERVDTCENVTVGANRTETVAGALRRRASSDVSLEGSSIAINGGANCAQAARVGDLVASPALTILTGSPTVCIG